MSPMRAVLLGLCTVGAAGRETNDGVALLQESFHLAPSLQQDEVRQEDALTEMAMEAEGIVVSTLQVGQRALLGEQGDSHAKKGKMAKQLAIPFVALVVGMLFLLGNSFFKIFGKILVFFGAQTFMNIFMKSVLSNGVVSAERHLKGFPAAFAVTAIQQITALVCFLILFACSKMTPWPYQPKVLSKRMEMGVLLVFSATFMFNIALNNFSLALLPLSVNLIIRSCAPLATYCAQKVLSRLAKDTGKPQSQTELALMLVGVACAAVAVVAKSTAKRTDADGEGSSTLVLGVIICIASLFSGAINMALAGVLGSMSLNPLDTTLYMSIPVFVFLLIPIFCIPHPSDWPGNYTDWQIVKEVAALSPGTIGLAFLSGVFALVYNVLQYTLVQTLSATHAAFAGNFNKAATIGLAILVQLEKVPPGACGVVMMLAILGNIIAFTIYNFMKSKEGKKAH